MPEKTKKTPDRPKSQSQPPPGPNVPFGTEPRRPAWPLTALLIVFAAWFAFLIWMAVKYPAR